MNRYRFTMTFGTGLVVLQRVYTIKAHSLDEALKEMETFTKIGYQIRKIIITPIHKA